MRARPARPDGRNSLPRPHDFAAAPSPTLLPASAGWIGRSTGSLTPRPTLRQARRPAAPRQRFPRRPARPRAGRCRTLTAGRRGGAGRRMRQPMSSPRPVPLPTELGGVEGLQDLGGGLGDAGAVVADLDQPPVAVAGRWARSALPRPSMPAERDAQRSASAGWPWTGPAQSPLSCGTGGPQDLTVVCLRGITSAVVVLVPLGPPRQGGHRDRR
jgi:hypothetical protein